MVDNGKYFHAYRETIEKLVRMDAELIKMLLTMWVTGDLDMRSLRPIIEHSGAKSIKDLVNMSMISVANLPGAGQRSKVLINESIRTIRKKNQ